jgi:hypothetical protein
MYAAVGVKRRLLKLAQGDGYRAAIKYRLLAQQRKSILHLLTDQGGKVTPYSEVERTTVLPFHLEVFGRTKSTSRGLIRSTWASPIQ